MLCTFGSIKVFLLVAVVTSGPSNIKNAAVRVSEWLKGTVLNLLVNNATIFNLGTVDSETPEAMAEVFKTND
ncbi:hypothetical protein JD844_000301 [Phrynosoma platyrhinos]|uniref:Uncharacterized protein n=1 Tax=Phrynosoma platyrhinos TaxID=52577 RepID=A0ABQ7SQH3_PHRPL|nr:hypothetical protein JD844_000301 [Phrynosoma platyrhinos]